MTSYYCERIQNGAELLNSLSSVLFIVIGILLIRQYKRVNRHSVPVMLLILLTGLLGIGSFSLHLTNANWARFADLVPAALITFALTYMYARHPMQFSKPMAIAYLLAYVVFNISYKLIYLPAAEGWFFLIPTLFFILLTNVYLVIARSPVRFSFLLANIFIFIGTGFRITDLSMCSSFPYGTHFIWHICMACFFFLTIREVVRRRAGLNN